MGDYLNNLKANRKMYEDSLVNLQSELTEARNKLRLGNHIRELGSYHMGQDMGHNPPSGVKYLENLELIIIPNLQDRIYIANDNIERLTSRIESLEPIAVPAAEAVVEEGAEDMTHDAPTPHPGTAVNPPGNLRTSSSSSEGEGIKKRRRNNRRKSHRRKSHRRKSSKHRSTRRNKRKSKKKP